MKYVKILALVLLNLYLLLGIFVSYQYGNARIEMQFHLQHQLNAVALAHTKGH
jgi:hypothetical protein